MGEGALRLDDSIEHWLPGLIPGGDAITVGHLAAVFCLCAQERA